MQKIKLLLLAGAPLIFGCSGDDDPTNVPVSTTPQYIKKITETISYGSGPDEQYIYDFAYTGTKLDKITVGEYESIFSYDGDKIISVTQTENGLPAPADNYHYTGDRLDYIVRDDETAERTDFHYVNGGLVGNTLGYTNGFDQVTLETNSFTFQNGNLSQWLQTSYFGGSDNTSRRAYTYDNHPNPLRDMNRYLRVTFRTEGLDGLSSNNPISEESFSPSGAASSVVYTYETNYNTVGFPTQIKRFSPEGSLISQTDIEYR